MFLEVLLAIAKAIGPPGSLGFFLLALAAAVLMLRIGRRLRPVGWVLLVATCAIYLALSLPVAARAIAGALPAVATADPAGRGQIDLLVVLDGDNRKGRVVEARRVFGTAAPRQVWALGGDALPGDLTDAGIPSDRLASDPAPSTTREQMARVRALVADHPTASVALVASRIQIPRVAALAAASGLHVVLVPSPLDGPVAVSGPRRWLPSVSALHASRDALYEHAALAYYAWRGWIGDRRN